MKTTLTSMAVVIALTFGIANQAQATHRAVLQILCYIEGGDGVYVSRVYSPLTGWAEVSHPGENYSATKRLQRFQVEVEIDAVVPCIAELKELTASGAIKNTGIFFFRASSYEVGVYGGVHAHTGNPALWGFDHIMGWGGDSPGGTSATNPPGSPVQFVANGSGDPVHFNAEHLGRAAFDIDIGWTESGKNYIPEGGGTDLTPVLDGQAAIEAKLDNLPAGPAGPQGDAGADGQAGGQGAQGKVGPAGAAGATGAAAPCVPCQDVADSAVGLACLILGETSPTNFQEIENAATVIVGSLMISTNICEGEGECDIGSEINSAIDAKLNNP